MNDQKIKYAIIISLILHAIVIGFLVFSEIMRKPSEISGNEGNALDAIMVDTNIATRQYQRQQQQQLQAEQAVQRRREQIEAQEQALQDEQSKRQQQLKELEKERLKAQANTQQAIVLKKEQEEAAQKATEQKKREEAAVKLALEQKKKEEEAARKALAEKKVAEEETKRVKDELEKQKKQAEAEKKKAQEEAIKAKAEADKQKRIAEEAKKKAQAARKQKAEVDDLFNELSSSKSDYQPQNNGGKAAGKNDVSAYQSMIKNAIQRNFNSEFYKGKKCSLEIQLAPDGLLLSVKSLGGDPALCREAIRATKSAHLPKPPNRQVYESTKNPTIDFEPK